MCKKTVFHNTYADGARDVTERVDTCTPGYMCANPRIVDVDRTIGCTKLQLANGGKDHSATLADRKPTPYYTDDRHIRPPTPRSISPPGSRGSDSERRHHKRGVYVNGVKVVDVRSGRGHRRERPIVHDSHLSLPHAPEPPAPRPIPIPRSATMPYGMETPPDMPMRGRRPIIIEDRVPSRHLSNTVPIGPVDVLEHASRRRSSRRDRDQAFLNIPRRHSRSPQGYASAEDERERQERHRRRRELRAHASVTPSSMPALGNTDVYGSSYGSSYSSSNGSSFSNTPPAVVGPSPAVTQVKKELRWEDQQRAEQNARIQSRPKLSRAATLSGTHNALHGEVKSILKNGPGAEPIVGLSRKSTIPANELDDLYRSVGALGLSEKAGSRESSADRRAREYKEREERDYAELKDRLKNRFSMPPRRFTAGTGAKRRTEVWYPDEGRYKYM